MPSDARTIAHRVLVRVDEGAAFASIALDAALRSAGRLERREAALATELVYGTLRRQLALDHALSAVSSRPLETLDASVRAALRLGAYQLTHTRVPPRAAINESVDLVKSGADKAKAVAGFVNAVLRGLTRTKATGPDPDVDPVGALALETSHPRWLVERWTGWLGPEATAALCRADDLQAGTSLRVNLARGTREEAVARLAAEGATAQPCARSPAGLSLVDGLPPNQLETLASGRAQVQDEAAQLVSLYAQPARGATVLDLCAAPGGKACHLAELVGPEGRVVAVDKHLRKTEDIKAAAARLGHANVEAHAADALFPLPFANERSFGLVLLDAPCSGLGTLRRHPELKMRRKPADLAGLAELQAALLDRAREYVAPGGYLVYAVCTLTAEECDRQVDRFLERSPDFALAPPIASPELADCLTPRGLLLTLPSKHGTDGFFAARFQRRA